MIANLTCLVRMHVGVLAIIRKLDSVHRPALVLKTAACSAGAGTWTLLDLETEISSRTLCAVAEASALAISTADGCLSAGIVYGGVGSTCPSPH
jgi:acetaldehyde dehydrogenase (acetylating)